MLCMHEAMRHSQMKPSDIILFFSLQFNSKVMKNVITRCKSSLLERLAIILVSWLGGVQLQWKNQEASQLTAHEPLRLLVLPFYTTCQVYRVHVDQRSRGILTLYQKLDAIEKRVYIGGLHSSVTDQLLHDRFSRYGTISSATVAKDDQGIFSLALTLLEAL